MSITHELSVRQDLCNNVVDRLDGGVLRYLNGSSQTVGDGTLSTPAFGPADGTAKATANPIGNATNSTGDPQTVASFAMRSTTADVFFGSVTGPGQGGDIEMTNTTVEDSEEIVTDSFTYTAAP